MGILLIIIIVCFLGWAVSNGAKLKKQYDAENATFMGSHEGWDIYVSPRDRGALALNHEARKIVVGTVTKYVEHPWSKLNTVEIEKNGQSIQKTNRGSQAMGAAVGAVLLGPVGLLMGGLTGSKRQKERISELSLKITIDDPADPVHRVTFFHSTGSGVDAKSVLLKEPARKMEHFHALVSNAVRSDHREAFATKPQLVNTVDPESRIAKLWDLHQAGAITAEEFAAQKVIILTPPGAAISAG